MNDLFYSFWGLINTLQRADKTSETLSWLLTEGETTLWCAARNVPIPQLANRYGHYAIRGPTVIYSAQVPCFD